MKCIYHRDNDGRCSAAIVARYFGIGNVEFISMQYGDNVPFEKFEKNETVVIVDFSLQKPGDWKKLLKITPNVTWIDHHVTSIENKDHPHHLPGKRSTEYSAAELTWEFFFHEETPFVVKLVGDYDTWKFEFKDKSKYFSAGSFLEHTYPDSGFWRVVLENDNAAHETIRNVIENGIIITKYNNRINESIIKYQSKIIDWEGYKTIIVNNRGSSTMFDSIPSPDYEICVWWYFNGKNFTVTVCSPHEHIDVTSICKRYGGGGHRQIGGFQIDKLLNIFISK